MHEEHDQRPMLITPRQLDDLIRQADEKRRAPMTWALAEHFNPDNIVEIAKSQFPRLEAQVAISADLERTKRLLIVVAAACLIAGATLIVFSPAGKEGVSYVIATLLGILPLGAIGVQEFRIRTIGVHLEGGRAALNSLPVEQKGNAEPR